MQAAQADLIWDELFLRHSPLSEACRGVLTTLHLLGVDAKKRDLPALRRWFAKQNLEKHIARCLGLAGVGKICMTNSPFDDLERSAWEKGFRRDERFVAALRIDPLLLDWPRSATRLAEWGYGVGAGLSEPVIGETRRFLEDWTRRMGAKYLMVSLPPDFAFPDRNHCAQLIEKAQVGNRERHQLDLDARELVAKTGIIDQRPAVFALHRRKFFQALQLSL